LKLLTSISLSFILFSVYAQDGDSVIVKRDTVKHRYLPTGLRIGVDVLSLVRSQVRDDFSGWEINGDVDFHRYFLAVDYGQWARTLNGDSSHYVNDGRYFRVGIDVNFLKKDPERNMFFLGLRYGHANFSESLSLSSYDKVWGLYERDYNNPSVKSRWFELVTGIKVKIWKPIWMGYTARFKFGLKSSGDNEMLSHDIPGYGRNDKETYWGFNYQVFFRIPFRPMPPLPLAK
jgi:hypothetical protein